MKNNVEQCLLEALLAVEEAVENDEDASGNIPLEERLIELGYTPSDAALLAPLWLECITKNAQENIFLRQWIRMDILEEHFGWGSLSESSKRDILWEAGIDTRTDNYYSGLTLVRPSINPSHRGDSGKLLLMEVVYGNERLDTEWITKRGAGGGLVASFEAQTYERRTRDSEFDRELSRMGGAV